MKRGPVKRSMLRLWKRYHQYKQARYARRKVIHLAAHVSAVDRAIDLIQNLPDSLLRDITFVEHELLPGLGFNDEDLDEWPAHLLPHTGKGLHVWQYPNQFAPFLVWLVDHAPGFKSYLEIGSRWGGTLVVLCEWLHRCGSPLTRIASIDPVGPDPLITHYANRVASRGVECVHLSRESDDPKAQDFFRPGLADVVLIDADHSLKASLADHLLARPVAKLVIHHDIDSWACPETGQLWNALVAMEQAEFTCHEFKQQYESVRKPLMGLGALLRRSTQATATHVQR
jgi:hypothetical protein